VVVLRPLNLRWINGPGDDPQDLCAHGDVEFRVGENVLLDPTAGRNLTVSAAALYLLRTLSAPHTKQSPVGDHLFPCCGFTMYDIDDQDDVVICGCPSGVDFEVRHQGGEVVIRSDEGREYRAAGDEWRSAVFEFADRVSSFYAGAATKQPADDEDRRGFAKFASEWERRRGRPLG
jgi:hypothetical protein